MRAHLSEARRYAELKHRLAQEYQTDREGYTQAKSTFIWEIMAKADTWSQDTGWQPGPTDA
jgi:GrpB-like predicted nucleotidyltransferase (UPF0157 family)